MVHDSGELHRGWTTVTRRSLFLLLPVLFLLLPAPGRSAPAGSQEGRPLVIATAEASGQIVVLAGDPVRPIAVARAGTRAHNLTVTPQGTVVVANQGATDVALVSVSAPGRAHRVGVGARPHDVASSEDGRRVYVLSEEGALVELDPATGVMGTRLQLRRAAHNLAVVGGELWITNTAVGEVYVVDARRMELTGRIRLPMPGHDLAVRPEGGEVWVTLWPAGEMVVVDARSRRVIRTVPAGRRPQHLAFDPEGGEVWVTDTGVPRAYVLDASTGRTMATVDLGGASHHVAVGGRRAYLTAAPAYVVVVDRTTRRVVQRVRVGNAPHDVSIYEPTGDRVTLPLKRGHPR